MNEYRIRTIESDMVVSTVDLIVEAVNLKEAIKEAKKGNGEVISSNEVERDTKHIEVVDAKQKELYQ